MTLSQEKRFKRQCAVCRQMRAREDLFRVVKTKEGPAFDPEGKIQGRGAYICRDPQCVGDAEKKRALSRSLHCPVPEEVYSQIREAWEEGGRT